MNKTLITAAELEKLIQDRISKSEELDGDCRSCIVNSVYLREPDESGSNWDLHSFRGPANCAEVISDITAKFKLGFNLKD